MLRKFGLRRISCDPEWYGMEWFDEMSKIWV